MKQVLSIAVFIFLAASLQAQDQKRQNSFNLEKGIAVQGYDVVSYFTKSKAVKGNSSLTLVYQGIKYQFSTTENKEEFKKNPSKYEPQYGGWCAYALGATGEKVEIDPDTFKIVNGKLYLFYNKYFNNTLPKWNKDEANLKAKADVNWAKYDK
jgi:YHS domain-containing protein